MTTLLEVASLDTFYGKSHVLRDLSFGGPRGRITTLLGRNGMGKTTTLRSIMGLTPPRSGTIRFDGRDITGQPSYRVARLGLGYVREGRQLCPHLDVGENLRLAALPRRAGGPWTHDALFEYFPILRQRWHQKARSLSGGEQQMLAIARALAGNPAFVMLDQPSQGLAPLPVRQPGSLMLPLKREGPTILLVEQHPRTALTGAEPARAWHPASMGFARRSAACR